MKVAIIGAGTSGLTSIKCCLDEGLVPICFERSEDIGGVWRYTPDVEYGRASIYQSVVSNTSKEMMCYSDFPYAEDTPNFLHNTKMLEYYREYAEKFGLLKYIQFTTLVHSVKKCHDFPTTGQWEVTTVKDGKQNTASFDAVMVCSGHHAEPNYPLESFPGINTFKGKYFHTREYKTAEEYKGKRVLIVGMGNSGTDIAVELSRVASQVYLSTRKGCWVMSRVFEQGYPWDICFDTRFQNWLRNILPPSVVTWLINKKVNEWFNHRNYGLQLMDSSQFKEPILNDELPSRITCGFVLVKPQVTQFTENGVKFDDGTIEENIDVVIFATGYAFSFPFLDESVLKVEDKKVYLYRNIFPVGLEKPTFGVIGLIQPLGPIMAAAEVQARWVTRVFKGLCKFPSLEEVLIDIENKKETLQKRFGTGSANILQLDYIKYLDEMATDMGIRPNILRIFPTDPYLALALLFGPCTPAQYRLVGPGKWPHARKQIMTTWDRIIKPLKTRSVKSEEPNALTMPYILGALCVLALFLSVFFSKY
ncbi:dimethylaniline monooxygenase [N-oxide-forming] 2-like [Pelobates fuscus]|uniref:dimethylaniline monooxygenase [N-oxide-forming] 2-like n=1 Tax=Pelobates fuscus TaxID=191477 RepID=UPI002FE4767E